MRVDLRSAPQRRWRLPAAIQKKTTHWRCAINGKLLVGFLHCCASNFIVGAASRGDYWRSGFLLGGKRGVVVLLCAFCAQEVKGGNGGLSRWLMRHDAWTVTSRECIQIAYQMGSVRVKKDGEERGEFTCQDLLSNFSCLCFCCQRRENIYIWTTLHWAGNAILPYIKHVEANLTNCSSKSKNL